MEKLSLKDYTHNEELSLVEFIYLFLVKFNEEHETINEENKITTDICKLRSLGDIFAISNTYYPDSTMEEVKEILLNFGYNLVGHFCEDIAKRVYLHRHLHVDSQQLDSGDHEYDEYDEDNDDYRMFDEYCEDINYRIIDTNKELIRQNIVSTIIKNNKYSTHE